MCSKLADCMSYFSSSTMYPQDEESLLSQASMGLFHDLQDPCNGKLDLGKTFKTKVDFGNTNQV